MNQICFALLKISDQRLLVEMCGFCLVFQLSMQPSLHCNLVTLVLARFRFGLGSAVTTVRKTPLARNGVCK